jgi:predicted membrane channel-forming protein YqfA (hemolysin III family)
MSPLKTELPKYTLAQELSNSITHGLGTVLTLIFGPFLILKAINSGNVWAIVS